jgi:hypothetical protein
MKDETAPSPDESLGNEYDGRLIWALARFLPAIAMIGLFVGTAAAQSSPGSAFCSTDMAQTIKNIFTLIQFGGPLLGGVLALGATVGLPFVRRSDWKKELKEIRNQGLLWGVIVAPLGTQIVAFLLNNVVAGGSSCGF